jgi:hypothetical protein
MLTTHTMPVPMAEVDTEAAATDPVNESARLDPVAMPLSWEQSAPSTTGRGPRTKSSRELAFFKS